MDEADGPTAVTTSPPPASTRGRWRFFLLAVAAAVALTLLLSKSALFQRLDLAALDLQMRYLSPPDDLSGLVGIDIDEKSMDVLEGQLGAWPYDRNVFALVTNFLREAGADVIVYDIVFSETRKGDQDFGLAIQRAAKVVLAATANSAYAFERAGNYESRIARLAWSRDRRIPHISWPDITLPIESLSVFPDRVVPTGVVAAQPDADGVLRRIALFHESRGYLLPAQPLAAIFAGGPIPAIDHRPADNIVKVGELELPVNDQGEALLQFSPPAEPVHLVPFYQVVLAALNAPGAQSIRDQLRGKKVFIGSTAAKLNDFRATPLGLVSGLQILMQIQVMLERGRILKPQSAAWTSLTTIVALVVPLSIFARSQRMHPLAGPGSAFVMLTLVVLCSALLFTSRQTVSMLFPLAAGLITHLLLSLLRLYTLNQERQRLTYEKFAAEEASRLKSQFMSHMTHELRTPLTAMLGFNRLIGEGRPDHMERSRYQEMVEKNGRHLLTLINNILDAARIEAGQMKISRESISVGEVIHDTIATLLPQAREKGLQFAARIDESLPPRLSMDGLRLKQIVLNLAGNGIKFTHEGRVAVEISWSHDTLTMLVEDTGPGISQKALEHIFEPFDQGDANAARRLGGSGLGLAISRNLCQLLGGSLTVTSIVGKGTRFTAIVHAPLGQEPAVARPPAVSATSLAGRVLLVDDNMDARDLISLHLQRFGLHVIQASDGATAIDLALHEQPDLVLMDMEMPVMSGVEATRTLRSGGFRQPILAVSAHTGSAELAMLATAGCDGHLAKPVDPEVLRTTLAGYLQSP